MSSPNSTNSDQQRDGSDVASRQSGTEVANASTMSFGLANLEEPNTSNAILSRPNFSMAEVTSGFVQRRESDNATIAKAAVKAIIGHPRRLSRPRNSVLQSFVDGGYGDLYARSRHRRGSAIDQLRAEHKDVPEETFSALFDVTRERCKALLDKKLPVERLFLVARPTNDSVRSQDIGDYLRGIVGKIAQPPLDGSVTGFCVLYPNHTVLVLEATEIILHLAFRFLEKSDTLAGIKVVFAVHDVPDRISNGFFCLTAETPFDHFTESDQTGEVDVMYTARIFVDRLVKICLKISAMYKVQEEQISQQILSQVKRLFVHPDHLSILLASDLLFPLSSYVRLSEGTVSLDNLGDDFEWAYPTAPQNV
ncbi:hypothetical protein BV898_10969 [Hypsibius exemplaris]|uniref:Uncharacterized protein n=1 Tax=Hypsibius exemplaris TaxID=2072580 RepID=A0A1W0WHX8_HYPEX|nr:hypothetical protein BV898_10969 [Hypsibius exemplaris]